MYRVESPGHPIHYRFDALSGVPHGVFTRHGGVSHGPWASLNVGHTVGDDPAAVAANEARVCAALGVSAARVATARQVHGTDVLRVAAQQAGATVGAADGLVTDASGVALLMRVADCAPVLLYGPDRGVVGIAHAGWRGALGGVAARTARVMIEEYGCDPRALRAGIGPSIGPCCYEVGAEVYEPFAARWGAGTLRREAGGGVHLDLWEANARALREVGVEHVEIAALCTCCRREEFYSHRGDGGRTGRLAAVIGLP